MAGAALYRQAAAQVRAAMQQFGARVVFRREGGDTEVIDPVADARGEGGGTHRAPLAWTTFGVLASEKRTIPEAGISATNRSTAGAPSRVIVRRLTVGTDPAGQFEPKIGDTVKIGNVVSTVAAVDTARPDGVTAIKHTCDLS